MNHYDVIVIGGGQAGLADRPPIGRAGPRLRRPRGGRRARRRLARALGLAAAVHARALRRAARHALPRRPGPPPVARRGRGLPDRLRDRPARRVGSRVSGSAARAGVPRRARRRSGAQAGRWWSRRARSRFRARRHRAGRDVLQLHSAAYRRPVAIPPRAACSWSAAATPGSRSPRSSPRAPGASLRRLAADAAAAACGAPDLFRLLTATGVMRVTAGSRIGRRMRTREMLIGSSPRRARRRGISLHGRAAGATGSRVHLRRRRRRSTPARSSGRPVSGASSAGSTSGARRRRRSPCTTAASPPRPASTSSACRGSTPAARRCWAGSRTTPRTSRRGSPPEPLLRADRRRRPAGVRRPRRGAGATTRPARTTSPR